MSCNDLNSKTNPLLYSPQNPVLIHPSPHPSIYVTHTYNRMVTHTRPTLLIYRSRPITLNSQYPPNLHYKWVPLLEAANSLAAAEGLFHVKVNLLLNILAGPGTRTLGVDFTILSKTSRGLFKLSLNNKCRMVTLSGPN